MSCHLSSQLYLTSREEAEEIFQLQIDIFFPPITILLSILDFSHTPLNLRSMKGEYVGAGSERNEAEE